MPYTGKTVTTEFRGGLNILASEHFQFIEGGGTLDAAKFGAVYIPVGTPIARNTTTGFFEPYKDDVDAVPEGFDEFSILNIDMNCDGKTNIVVGEVLIRGSVYDAKLPASVTAAFKAATSPQIRYIKHIKQ